MVSVPPGHVVFDQVTPVRVARVRVARVRFAPGPNRYPPWSIHPAGSDCGVPVMPPLETTSRFAPPRFAR